MPKWLSELDWKYIIADLIIPIVTFVIGLFTGKAIEKRATAKLKGNHNTVIQNSEIKPK